METAVLYRCFIGIMEKKMVTTIIYWGYIGIMEKKMEITILYGTRVFFVCCLVFFVVGSLKDEPGRPVSE